MRLFFRSPAFPEALQASVPLRQERLALFAPLRRPTPPLPERFCRGWLLPLARLPRARRAADSCARRDERPVRPTSCCDATRTLSTRDLLHLGRCYLRANSHSEIRVVAPVSCYALPKLDEAR